MIKVLFDYQVFELQKFGGIPRYFAEMFRCFNDMPGIEYELPVREFENEYLRSIPPFSAMKVYAPKSDVYKKNPLLRKLSKAYNLVNPVSNLNLGIKALKQQRYDLFHPTYSSPYFLRYLGNKPFVLTVYDLIHELFPGAFPTDTKTVRNKKELIGRATKIIAISESTKQDLIKLYNVPKEKIQVTYLANSLTPASHTPQKPPSLPGKYILFVGSRAPYKNFSGFITAVAPLLKQDKELYVIAAGGYARNNNFSETEQQLLHSLGIENQVLQFPINDATLIYLYQHARCFVFPTLYEGFGIPILEAFACNCPAVISNTSSLPEVGGDAAFYIDPSNEESIFRGVEKVISDESLRKSMIEKGQVQHKKFSWQKTAGETFQVYQQLV